VIEIRNCNPQKVDLISYFHKKIQEITTKIENLGALQNEICLERGNENLRVYNLTFIKTSEFM